MLAPAKDLYNCPLILDTVFISLAKFRICSKCGTVFSSIFNKLYQSYIIVIVVIINLKELRSSININEAYLSLI